MPESGARSVGSTVIDISTDPNPSEGADRVGGQLRGDKEWPFSGVTKLWQSLEEGAGKRCSECEFGGRCRKAMLGVWPELVTQTKRHEKIYFLFSAFRSLTICILRSKFKNHTNLSSPVLSAGKCFAMVWFHIGRATKTDAYFALSAVTPLYPTVHEEIGCESFSNKRLLYHFITQCKYCFLLLLTTVFDFSHGSFFKSFFKLATKRCRSYQ